MKKAEEVGTDRMWMKNVYNVSMGALAIAAGNHAESITYFDKVEGKYMTQAWAHWRKAIAQLVMGENEDAKKTLDALGAPTNK